MDLMPYPMYKQNIPDEVPNVPQFIIKSEEGVYPDPPV